MYLVEDKEKNTKVSKERTSITLDPSTLLRAKKAAVVNGISFSKMVNDALEFYMKNVLGNGSSNES